MIFRIYVRNLYPVVFVSLYSSMLDVDFCMLKSYCILFGYCNMAQACTTLAPTGHGYSAPGHVGKPSKISIFEACPQGTGIHANIGPKDNSKY